MNQIIQVKQAASVFKALGDENRIRILLLLGGGELCACKLLEYLQISQSTLSHHMKILCDAGIVTGRKEGRWTHYSRSVPAYKCSPPPAEGCAGIAGPDRLPMEGSLS